MLPAGRLPWLTLLLTTIMSALYEWTRQDAAALQALWYSRDGLLDGESWRLLTGHLVHFSFSHFAWNLFAFGALALQVERHQGAKSLGTLLLFLAIPASLLMLLLAPQLHYYGGISSINYGLLTWICLTHATVRQRVTCAPWHIVPANLVVAGLLAHAGFQYASGASLFSVASVENAVRVAWQTHLACTVTAVILALAGKLLQRKPDLITP